MPYKIDYDPETDCIMASMEGNVDRDVLREFVTELARVSNTNKCYRILNDMRKARLKLGFLSLYNIPRMVKAAGLNLSSRRAIVAREDLKDYSFFRSIARKQGQRVKVFTDYDEAIKWLFEIE